MSARIKCVELAHDGVDSSRVKVACGEICTTYLATFGVAANLAALGEAFRARRAPQEITQLVERHVPLGVWCRVNRGVEVVNCLINVSFRRNLTKRTQQGVGVLNVNQSRVLQVADLAKVPRPHKVLHRWQVLGVGRAVGLAFDLDDRVWNGPGLKVLLDSRLKLLTRSVAVLDRKSVV